MSATQIAEPVLKDLTNFVSQKYVSALPNSLLVAQSFILKYPDFGKEYGLMKINNVVEEGVRSGYFK